jgi:hypothetical protein
MPLNSPEDYVRLGTHLEETDVVFQQFLRVSGYSDNTGALGRYPHKSAVLEGEVCRKIDLQMETDLDGHRFDHFFPEIPYTLWAGAWLDESDSRYGDGGIIIFERLPFFRVKEVLLESLAEAARRLEVVRKSLLKEFSKRTTIRKN